ncbi:MAG: hypothetical protein FJ086_02350 [Deltaproteobacteria bacterium]|nr:hypothetical protein [Deltaproteobacteria bacterium]
MSQPHGLLRAAGLGLGAALFFGGLGTLSLGARSALTTVDCAALSEAECALASDLRRDELRLYLPEGAALVMLSAAVFLGLRKLDKREKTP